MERMKQQEKDAKQQEKEAKGKGTAKRKLDYQKTSRPPKKARNDAKKARNDADEEINDGRCCICFGMYEDDAGTDRDWIMCSCGRWMHEGCVDFEDINSNTDKLCPLC